MKSGADWEKFKNTDRPMTELEVFMHDRELKDFEKTITNGLVDGSLKLDFTSDKKTGQLLEIRVVETATGELIHYRDVRRLGSLKKKKTDRPMLPAEEFKALIDEKIFWDLAEDGLNKGKLAMLTDRDPSTNKALETTIIDKEAGRVVFYEDLAFTELSDDLSQPDDKRKAH